MDAVYEEKNHVNKQYTIEICNKQAKLLLNKCFFMLFFALFITFLPFICKVFHVNDLLSTEIDKNTKRETGDAGPRQVIHLQ